MSSQGKLFIVATPLGNLADFSSRAIQILTFVDTLYAEDTRRSRILLEHYGIAKPIRSLHEHNENNRISELLAILSNGKNVALITDAGTPAISDPGTIAVAKIAAAGFNVIPIPGPSALTTALSAAGFYAGAAGVLFLGFLPTRGRIRRDSIKRVSTHNGVVVLFEAPHRLIDTIKELAESTPNRNVCLARELTKIHEEFYRGTLIELSAKLDKNIKGEITLVLDAQSDANSDSPEIEAIDSMLNKCLDIGLSARDATAAVAAITSFSRREVYTRCELIKNKK
ncbi:MAG: 16S rRNA (cytidine(1402)-2'-O)-methyltransferase [Deltaproteobacteria bacterium]|nr:16S rRNA (cytidine(1402)-2'-O)-methyltransferase [Deltaproteobacteria bacterium]